MNNTTGKQITDRLREVWKDYGKAKMKLKVSMDKVESIYKHTADDLKQILGKKQ